MSWKNLLHQKPPVLDKILSAGPQWMDGFIANLDLVVHKAIRFVAHPRCQEADGFFQPNAEGVLVDSTSNPRLRVNRTPMGPPPTRRTDIKGMSVCISSHQAIQALSKPRCFANSMGSDETSSSSLPQWIEWGTLFSYKLNWKNSGYPEQRSNKNVSGAINFEADLQICCMVPGLHQ